MPKKPPAYCRTCKRPATEAGPISWQGFCEPCGEDKRIEHNKQLAAHNGPAFQTWRHRIAASVGAVIPGD